MAGGVRTPLTALPIIAVASADLTRPRRRQSVAGAPLRTTDMRATVVIQVGAVGP